MALANHTRPAPFGAITTFNLVTFVEALVQPLIDWNTNRKTYNMLSAMSDRYLEDIGLVRGDLEHLPTRF